MVYWLTPMDQNPFTNLFNYPPYYCSSVGGGEGDAFPGHGHGPDIASLDSVGGGQADVPYLPPRFPSTQAPAPAPSQPLQYTIGPDYSEYQPDYSMHDRTDLESYCESSVDARTPRLRAVDASSPEDDAGSPWIPPHYDPESPFHSYHHHHHHYDVHNNESFPAGRPPLAPSEMSFSDSSSPSSAYSNRPTPELPQAMQTSDPSTPPRPPSPGWLYSDNYLRNQLGIEQGTQVDLWALPDPPDGQKPPQPLPVLVKLAIHGSERGKLTLQEIYRALEERFVWFRQNENNNAWKNSIRHNLSLNQVFVSSERPITEPGKGRYWGLDLSKGEGYKRERKRRRGKKGGQSKNDDMDMSEDAEPSEAEVTLRKKPTARLGGQLRVPVPPPRTGSAGSNRYSPYPQPVPSTSSSAPTTYPASRRAPPPPAASTSSGPVHLVQPSSVPPSTTMQPSSQSMPHFGHAISPVRVAMPKFGQTSFPNASRSYIHPMYYARSSNVAGPSTHEARSGRTGEQGDYINQPNQAGGQSGGSSSSSSPSV